MESYGGKSIAKEGRNSDSGRGPAYGTEAEREGKGESRAGLVRMLPCLEGKRVILTVPFGEGRKDGKGA